MLTTFLGTSEFAATVLERLAGGPHRPALVVTRPDRPSGRGRRLTAPPVADAARELGLELSQPASINEPGALAAIDQRVARREAPQLVTSPTAGDMVLVVCAFGALIKEPLLSAYPMLNVHPSLLPRWRGAAPIERAIMAGDERTGVSIMQLTAGLDSGPVCRTAEERIEPQDTYGSLAPRLAALGGQLLVEVLDEWEGGAPPAFAAQQEARATYAEKIGPEDRVLDPGRPARELERVVRALYPHVGARIALGDGAMLGVQRARTLAGASGAGLAGIAGGTDVGAAGLTGVAAGALASADGRLLYGTAEGALELLEVQPPGKRPMDAASYLRGHALPGA